MVKAIKAILSVLGPGIFAIGYTIGTGSVTSMAKAGADYIEAGCVGVAASGSLVNKEWIAAGEYGKIAEVAKRLVENCRCRAHE